MKTNDLFDMGDYLKDERYRGIYSSGFEIKAFDGYPEIFKQLIEAKLKNKEYTLHTVLKEHEYYKLPCRNHD